MSNKILTITVPTYNIENYIGKCIESFKAVNSDYYSDFEVLIINDGSTDNSVQVVENLMEDSNLDLRIITKENGGHGSTINRGIKEASGKYFKVIDGDDWINVPEFESLLDKLKEIDTDLVISDYTEQHVYNNSTVLKEFSSYLTPNQETRGIPTKWTPMHALVYKTSILKDNAITISENTFYVDQEYTMLPLQFVENYIYYKLDIYQYFLGRADQSMNIAVMKKRADHHERVTKRILDLYKEIHVKNTELEKVVSDSLQYLVNMQNMLYVMNDELEKVYNLFSYAEKSGFKFKFETDTKTSNLLYINYKTKYLFNLVIKNLVKRKANSLEKEFQEKGFL